MSRFPHGGEVLGAQPANPLLAPVLSTAGPLDRSPQRAMLDLQAIQRIPGLAGYWPADPAYLYEDSAGTIPASVNGVVGCSRRLGDAPVYTPVTVTNPNFATDSDWTKGTGWTIADGVATKAAGTGSALSQAVSLTPGNTYLVTWTQSQTGGTTLTPTFSGGTTVNGPSFSTSGTWNAILVALTGNTTLNFSASSSFAGTIDNVTLVAVSNAPALQATTANKPYLRRTPTSNVHWLDSNTSTSALTATLGNLGSSCTVAQAGAEGVTFTEGVTISSTYNIAPAYGFNGDIAIFNRALTATERALLTRYMQRGVPVLGANLITNGTFDSATGWTVGTNWAIGSGVATKTGGVAGTLIQSLTPSGHVFIKANIVRTAGSFNFYVGGSVGAYTIAANTEVAAVLAPTVGTSVGVNGNTASAGTVDNLSYRYLL